MDAQHVHGLVPLLFYLLRSNLGGVALGNMDLGKKKEKIRLNTTRLPSATGLREPGTAQQQAAKTTSWAETQGIGTADLQTKTFPPLTSVMCPGCWRGGPQPAGRACEGPKDRRHHHKPSTNLREVLPRLKPSGGCQPG